MILKIMNINELQNLKILISMSGNKHAVSYIVHANWRI